MKPENMTILTVDDTPANIRLLTHQLEKQGYRVITAEDGFEGFKSAITYKPDLILLDIMMPGTDGYEVCELLKAEEQTRDIPVMFLTAKTDVEDRVRGFELGAVDYITKPFNLVEISARVQNQLEMKHCQRQNERLKNIVYHMHPLLPLKQSGELLLNDLENIKSYAQTVEGWLSIAGSFTEEPENYNLDFLIDDIVEVMQNGVSGLIGFNIDCERSGESIQGYPGLVHLALLNCFMNAYEAMNSKGIIQVRKTVGPLPGHLNAMMEGDVTDSYLIVDTEDKGIHDGRSVFDPGNPYELKDPDFKEFTLRLAAIHEIMRKHRGAVEVSAVSEKEFHTTLYFPNE